jgi:mono/diheme cytochrome c family protein
LSSGAEDKAFRFPGGDPEAGEKAFVSLNCIQCHTVKGVDLEEPKGSMPLNLELAAEARFVGSYEDIIRAITNPKHVVTKRYRDILTATEQAGSIEPLMPDMTSDMSAKQLMDLVVFLDRVYATSGVKYEKSKR